MSSDLWNKIKNFIGIPMEEEGLEPFDSLPVATSTTAVLEEDRPELQPLVAPRRGRERAAAPVSMPIAPLVSVNPISTQSEVMIIEPKSFDDAKEVVHSLRERRSVILNMKGLESELAQRLLYFVSGATHALDGNQKMIGEGIFLFSPSNVSINPLGAEQPWLQRDASDLFWRVR